MANLFTNGTFEVDTSGWTVQAGATIARSTVQKHGGVASMLVTNNATDDGTNAPELAGISPNTRYYFDMWVYPLTLMDFRFGWNEQTSGSSYLGTYQDNALAVAAGVWTKISFTKITAATCGRLQPFVCTSNGSQDFYIDDVTMDTTQLTLDTCIPDADLVTTGWTTAPLFSKVNDASDATVIQATAV